MLGEDSRLRGNPCHLKGIVIEDPSMEPLLVAGAKLERLWTGAKWAEGPVYFHEDDSLVWSNVPNNRMLKWTRKDGTRLFRAPSQFANGNYRDHEGRLVTCEHMGAASAASSPTGTSRLSPATMTVGVSIRRTM